ncbi:ACT domain-containing protein [Bowmanella dokdonensis]|uniref:ACT domain-containing protein n=1 Tax=Bowmanella dokdonensis TaxID=751969 RepID=A0A939DRF3_9ALTE|nr:ACT domain-containing protein [Bowmanella dokdonensis]MBN7827437.1 ACT domain-containing protein [Bowmanella dokdonensis]
MSGEINLDHLIQSMQPVLHEELFVFVTRPATQALPGNLIPRMQFLEQEGMTLIVEQYQADLQGWDYQFPCRMITLNVHSSLEAIGFLAKITVALAKRQMGVNPVSAFYHDHLFVPADKADEAMQCLIQLSVTT